MGFSPGQQHRSLELPGRLCKSQACKCQLPAQGLAQEEARGCGGVAASVVPTLGGGRRAQDIFVEPSLGLAYKAGSSAGRDGAAGQSCLAHAFLGADASPGVSEEANTSRVRLFLPVKARKKTPRDRSELLSWPLPSCTDIFPCRTDRAPTFS